MSDTWQTLLADLRADLQDTGETPRWSNATLWTYTKDAVRDYSIWFPRRIDRVALVAEEGHYPLPADFIEDLQVESPLGTFLQRRRDLPGSRASSDASLYAIQGGNLYIPGTPLEAYLTYLAAHPVPTSEAELDFTFTVPLIDMELIRLYVKAKIQEVVRGRQSNLDRFKPVGNRTDNPLTQETANLMEDYQRKIAERTKGGVIALYRAKGLG
jgi:hypothetical protein